MKKTTLYIYLIFYIYMGLDSRKPVLGGGGGGVANNRGADQPAHPRSLISAFVISFLKYHT